jgi:hypothetical protein
VAAVATQAKSGSDLYGLPLNEFIPQRDELVKRLRAEGEKEEAARVAKLRKPSAAAWAVNQLVRTQKKAINQLFKAGDEQIEAQAKAVSGKGSAEALKQATRKQREATEKLLEAADGLLSSEGHAPAAAVQERVSETLRAAAVDPDSREQVKDGCLAKELRFTGIAGFGADSPMHSEASDEKRGAERRQRAEELEAARERKQEIRQELKKAQAEFRAAEQQLRSAEKLRDRASRAAEQAEQALAEAEDQVKELQRGGR